MQLLFWCPRCWRVAGRMLFVVCSSLALLGWRLASRVDQVERKTGILIELDKALASVPLPIPTTAAGIALALLGTVTGLMLARSGRWAEKLS